SSISVNKGETVRFKVNTAAAESPFTIDVYRLGYYGGMGARKIVRIAPTAGEVTLANNQPNCITDTATGLVDCGNWTVTGSWAVPADAASGIYIGKLTRTDTGGASHLVFIVRDDARAADLLFQTSDTTWQGYDRKYWTGVDTDRFGPALVGAAPPKAFLSVGHDEYWSAAQRSSVEAARNAGVHLAFFSGNEMFWKTRWEASIAGPAEAYKTLV